MRKQPVLSKEVRNIPMLPYQSKEDDLQLAWVGLLSIPNGSKLTVEELFSDFSTQFVDNLSFVSATSSSNLI